jgi:hypothetical protein
MNSMFLIKVNIFFCLQCESVAVLLTELKCYDGCSSATHTSVQVTSATLRATKYDHIMQNRVYPFVNISMKYNFAKLYNLQYLKVPLWQ